MNHARAFNLSLYPVLAVVFGMVLGPQGLNLFRSGPVIEWFGHGPGLATLYIMAGMDLDLQKVKGRPIVLAVRGWLLWLAIWACGCHCPPLIAQP
jgi:hypothetical protein